MVDKVAAIWVLRRDGTALLQHRDEKPGLRHAGLWVPPGGHADPGESMSDCARRELREETEYDALDLRFLMAVDRNYEDGAAYRVTYFWCWYDEVQSVVCHEGQALAFVDRSAAASYPIPIHIFEGWDAALAASRPTSDKVQP
jgi:ADP-ribose pyrophosphatase YjhB (NUDIX family)